MTVATSKACRIIVDLGKCSGLGLCEAVAPDHFEIDEDGSLILLDADVSSEARGEVEEAVRSCPTQAITLEDYT